MEMKNEVNALNQEGNKNNNEKAHSTLGGRKMQTTANTQKALTHKDIADRFGSSPLRKVRCESMKRYLQKNGEFHLLPKSEQLLPSWTRNQVEQALDDVLYLGFGKVGGYYENGGCVIKFIERDSEKKA